MLCLEVLGNIHDEECAASLGEKYGAYELDEVSLDWDEAFKKLHRKTSACGRDVGIHLGDWVLSRGLSAGDVLGIDEAGDVPAVLVVALAPTDCLVIDVDEDHPSMLAKVGWEVGNTHTPLFFGEGGFQVLCSYSEPVERLLTGLHGVSAHRADAVLDPARRVSANRHGHHHDHGGHGHHHDHGDHGHHHDHEA